LLEPGSLIGEWGMTPEEKARQKIDQQLEQCGWIVQDYRQMDISAGRGVAVREFPLSTGEADYLLYADSNPRPSALLAPARRLLYRTNRHTEGHTI
jgi:hypothetical protein